MRPHLLVQRERRLQQAVRRLQSAEPGELLEHRVRIGGQVRVGGQVADVGVEARALRVVVAGREMPVAAQPPGLAARDDEQLGMRLQADDAVHDLRADRLEALGPVDVRLLVEARLQLDDRHHLLAAARAVDQQVHQRRLRAGAVDRLLDREHRRVVDCFAQQLHDRLERLERMVQQHVAGLQPREDRVLARQAALRPDRLVGREAQRGRVGLVDQLVQAHQVDRPVDPVERPLRQPELLQQERRQLLRTGVDDLEPDRLAEVARRQPGAQRLAQVRHVVGVDLEIGVAGDPELRERLDLAAGEQLAEVGADHAGQQHEDLAAVGQRVGKADHARQHARHLDDRHAVAPPERILAAEPRDEVQRLVRDLRKRMRRVEADRHQQRPDLRLEEAPDPALLRRRCARRGSARRCPRAPAAASRRR